MYCGHNLNFADGMELTSFNVCQEREREKERGGYGGRERKRGEAREGEREKREKPLNEA